MYLDRCFDAPMWTEGEAHEHDTELKMDRELTDYCKWSLLKNVATWLYNSIQQRIARN